MEKSGKYHLTAPEGLITSPNWPKKYQAKQKCHWLISAPPQHHIELKFDQFKLEYHKSCRMDRVEVFHIKKQIKFYFDAPIIFETYFYI